MPITYSTELLSMLHAEERSVYSNEQLQGAVNTYESIFGDSAPLELLTAAASTFRSRELMSILLDRVKTNNPVRNWNEFTLLFLGEAERSGPGESQQENTGTA